MPMEQQTHWKLVSSCWGQVQGLLSREWQLLELDHRLLGTSQRYAGVSQGPLGWSSSWRSLAYLVCELGSNGRSRVGCERAVRWWRAMVKKAQEACWRRAGHVSLHGEWARVWEVSCAQGGGRPREVVVCRCRAADVGVKARPGAMAGWGLSPGARAI